MFEASFMFGPDFSLRRLDLPNGLPKQGTPADGPVACFYGGVGPARFDIRCENVEEVPDVLAQLMKNAEKTRGWKRIVTYSTAVPSQVMSETMEECFNAPKQVEVKRKSIPKMYGVYTVTIAGRNKDEVLSTSYL